MTMYNINMFSHKNLTYERQRVPKRKKSNISLHDWEMWQMVHLHAIGHIPDTSSITLKLVGDESDFVPALDQALC